MRSALVVGAVVLAAAMATATAAVAEPLGAVEGCWKVGALRGYGPWTATGKWKNAGFPDQGAELCISTWSVEMRPSPIKGTWGRIGKRSFMGISEASNTLERIWTGFIDVQFGKVVLTRTQVELEKRPPSRSFLGHPLSRGVVMIGSVVCQSGPCLAEDGQ